MYARQITNEETYTLAEARQILNEETKLKRDAIFWKIKQKVMGVSLIIISIAIPFIFQDVTVSIFILPLGLYLLFTKGKVIY